MIKRTQRIIFCWTFPKSRGDLVDFQGAQAPFLTFSINQMHHGRSFQRTCSLLCPRPDTWAVHRWHSGSMCLNTSSPQRCWKLCRFFLPRFIHIYVADRRCSSLYGINRSSKIIQYGLTQVPLLSFLPFIRLQLSSNTLSWHFQMSGRWRTCSIQCCKRKTVQ